MKPSGKRLSILTPDEIEEIYGLPKFSHEDRLIYFSFNHAEKEMVDIHRSYQSILYFILQLGYFKAKKMFFVFDFSMVREDVRHILIQYFPEINEVPVHDIPKMTSIDMQKKILGLFEYRLCDQPIKTALKFKAIQLAKVCTKPIYIFKELVNYLESQKIVLPGYSFFQEEVVGKALTNEQSRLESAIEEKITSEIRAQLKNLLKTENDIYALTILKKEPKDFSYKEMSLEINKCIAVKSLFVFARGFLKNLEISNENIRYYASLVDYYTIYKLNRMSRGIVSVYLLCFVHNRYQRIKDNLINCLISLVRKYAENAKQFARDQVYAQKVEVNENLNKISKVLDLFIDSTIPDDISLGEFKKRAFGILPEEKIPVMVRYISTTKFDETGYVWDHHQKLAKAIKKNLRPVFMNIDFESNNVKDPLIKGVNFLKKAFKQGKSLNQFDIEDFPYELIPKKLKRYLYESKQKKISGKSCRIKSINGDKYEFLIYLLLRKYLESGDVFSRDSVRFRSFEDDLIDEAKWKQKDIILKELDLPVLNTPIEQQLKDYKVELEDKYHEVNRRITEGENKYIKVTGKGEKAKWSLPYKKAEEKVNNPIYEKLPQIGISDLLHFVNGRTGFMNAFTHTLSRYVKSDIDDSVISACIIASGTNLSLPTMADISDLNFSTLYTASNNFIRLETLRNANDLVSNATALLPIFKHYNIEDDTIHSSSDGQKFETQIHTINSRYSSKYFGLRKGISAYSLVANHIPINAKIIGANEHESHYVFDLLYNNTTDIEPAVHSTDTHGVNNVNFWILNAFGYQFAPRYKNLRGKSENGLYGFNKLSHYQNYLLKPIRRIKETLVISEWPNVQKIIASLALKETTQSIIIRKLSSYGRKNRTKKAMWELDNIVRSLYVLDFIDNISVRRNVQRVLNRGESYQQLKRMVSHANFGRLKAKTEVEQQIWNECSRLITNCIIYYNATLLSELLVIKEKEKHFDMVDLLKRISPVAWQHINLRGRYLFRNQKSHGIDLMEIIDSLYDIGIEDTLIKGSLFLN